jgi:hypothetical protein
MSKIVVYEKRVKTKDNFGKKVMQVFCFAKITTKGFLGFPKLLYRTPDYATFGMLVTALADFDYKSKVMDVTAQGGKQSRQERRQVMKSVVKDLMKG